MNHYQVRTHTRYADVLDANSLALQPPLGCVNANYKTLHRALATIPELTTIHSKHVWDFTLEIIPDEDLSSNILMLHRSFRVIIADLDWKSDPANYPNHLWDFRVWVREVVDLQHVKAALEQLSNIRYIDVWPGDAQWH